MLRLTAKATQFGRGTFTSWLIESAGTLPIQRPKDASGQPVDNRIVFGKLIDALEQGDMICMFPEGLSRYFATLAPLKQGVARIVSDTLSRQRNNPSFELQIQTCSITYLHRNLFRSDVLVTFHKPIVVSAASHPGLVGSPATPADYAAVRALTATMGEQIRAGTLDAPDWKYIRLANTARRLYAPLGTRLGLGDHIRLTQRFVDAFANQKRAQDWPEQAPASDLRGALSTPMAEKPNGIEDADKRKREEDEVDALAADLQTYQDLLTLHGLKDDRVRNERLLSRRVLWKRLAVRLTGAAMLFVVSIPGLLLWTPAFLMCRRATARLKRSGPVFDTYDEIAQTKLVYGFLTSMAVLVLANLVCLPFLPVTVPLFPTLMWLSLRHLEDCISSLRAALSLFRLLHLGKRQLLLLREMREGLRQRVVEVGVRECGLPRSLDEFEQQSRGWRVGRVVGFFSLQTRRKKDWNEALKLFDVTDYPSDSGLPPDAEPVTGNKALKAD